MITCREMISFLSQYLDGDLSAERRAVFEEHLAICPPCVRYIDSYRETIRLGKAAFDDFDAEVPNAVPPDLLKAILAARSW